MLPTFMKPLMKLPVIPDNYLGDISLTYNGTIALLKPTAIPHMNLPITPAVILGTIKIKVPQIPIKSVRIIAYRLLIIFRRELILRAASPAATAKDALNNP